MNKLGQKITAAEIQEIMQKHDIKKEGHIDFEEFRLIFQNLS
jgi:Ca2+-binding EF-hand superfamily protein